MEGLVESSPKPELGFHENRDCGVNPKSCTTQSVVRLKITPLLSSFNVTNTWWVHSITLYAKMFSPDSHIRKEAPARMTWRGQDQRFSYPKERQFSFSNPIATDSQSSKECARSSTLSPSWGICCFQLSCTYCPFHGNRSSIFFWKLSLPQSWWGCGLVCLDFSGPNMAPYFHKF